MTDKKLNAGSIRSRAGGLSLVVLAILVGCSTSSDEKTPNSPADNAEVEADSALSNGIANDKPAPFELSPPTKTSWPSFRNGLLQRGVAGSTLPDKLELIWKFPTPDGVVAAPAIVGKHAYVPTLSGDLLCIELATGNRIWRYRSIKNLDPEEFAPGFKAGPTVTADTVYAGDEDGVFHAVDRATGKQKWIFKTGAEIAGGAAVVGDHVIFGSHDSFLYSLNMSDGSVHWKFQTEDRINCSTAIVEKYTFVTGCDSFLRVIDIENGQQKSEVSLGSYLLASPAVLGDMLYVGTADSEVLAVDWRKASIVWRYRDPMREFRYAASAAVTDKYVVVGSLDRQMHCIDRKTGQGLWKFPTRGRIDSSAVIVGDRIFFGSADRNIYALNLSDGKQLWKYNAGESISASPAVGEEYLVIGTEGQPGNILCFGKKTK